MKMPAICGGHRDFDFQVREIENDREGHESRGAFVPFLNAAGRLACFLGGFVLYYILKSDL